MKEEKKIVTVFITKYALTTGIMEETMEIQEGGKYCYGKPKDWFMNTLFNKNDFFLTREEAIADCEIRREKKIQSLRKQMTKLVAKKFV